MKQMKLDFQLGHLHCVYNNMKDKNNQKHN
jgi:hypothetical protein